MPNSIDNSANSSLRVCYVKGDIDGMLGLHLSRAPWDPYPWVSGVLDGSTAFDAGIKIGDCVIEVNGVDVIGLKIVEVAEKIRGNWKVDDRLENGVTFLLWNSKSNQNSLNPQSLQKFTTCLQNVAQLLECPICLEVVKPPAWQCSYGHVLCANCRSRSTRCPICRVSLGPRGRCLIADKIFTLLAETFPCENAQNTAHGVCSPTKPCSPMAKEAPRLNATKKPFGLRKIMNQPTNDQNRNHERFFKFNCPIGANACTKLGTQHELLTHLQKCHHTAVTQYYCELGDRVNIKFCDKSLTCIAIPKNGNLEMFVVSRLKSSDRSTDGDLCWIWYVGNASDAQAYSVRLDCGNRSKWRGNATSLESSITEVLKASRYAIVEVGCTHVFVEIK